MSRRRPMVALTLTLAALAYAPPATLRAQDELEAAPQVQNPFRPFDRAAYEAHARELGATDAQLQEFAQQIDDRGVGRAADNLMRALRPPFDAAVALSEGGDPKAALALTQLLQGVDDPVFTGHVRYHLARVFLDGDDPERAVDILNEYLDKNINRTPLDAEVAYFYAQALAEIPEPELALPRFRAFLLWFPAASERYRASAQQRIAELEQQRGSQLHELADRMKKVGRDLRKQKTDDPVQTEQLDITEELQTLIEMFQEMERQASGAPNGNQEPSAPANQSALTEGEGRIGNLEKRVSLADRWGEMKDADRKEIESAIQNGLPPQYRKMLEEYYKKLGTGAVGK